MNKYETKDIRNVALIAHGGSGKTSIAEALLFNNRITTRLGRVDDGTSLMDYEPEEIKRKITISSSFHHLEWQKCQVNLIDTPGDANFIADTRNSLQVADSAVLVIDAISGVQVQTEKVWDYCNQFSLPRCIFINKLDRERSDLFRTVENVKKYLKIKPLILQLPLGAEHEFTGLIDLIEEKALLYRDDLSGTFTVEEIPADMKEKAEEFKTKLIEDIAESNDELLEKFLEGTKPSKVEMLSALKQGIISQKLFPILLGSALRNIGMQPLLDFIIECFPSPAERGAITGLNPKTKQEIKAAFDESGPFAGFVFKLEGKGQKPINPAIAGDIVAVAKLKETTTGDSLSDEKNPVVFQGFTHPNPILSFALLPKGKGDEEKIFSSLSRLIEEDPTLRLDRDAQTKEMLLSGMGQVHLETTIEKLKRKFGVEVTLQSPKIPYRETIRQSAKSIIYRHKKQSGGRGQFAEVHFDIFPLERGKGYEFDNDLVGMNVPRNFVPAVEKGLNDAKQRGVMAGYPVVDFKIRFFDGKSHEVDSSELAFKIASSMAFKKAVQQALPMLLEPIMKVIVNVPDENMGDVIGDLNSRRGRVLGVDSKDNHQIITAHVPMSEILTYASELTSLTSGRGTFTVEYSSYEEVPAHISEKIVSQTKVVEEDE
ncbi:MAG: elongation factor G [Proteobacteria bacterium]|nr:elongation factor G [Pseudomonadota bacterium]